VFLRLGAKVSGRRVEQRINMKFCAKLGRNTNDICAVLVSMTQRPNHKVYNGNSRHSSVGIALRYGLDNRGSRFDSRRGLGIFLFTTASRTALRPTRPSIQWVPGALSLGVKRLGREADHSPSSSAKVKECVELYLHSTNTPSWCGP
jgi:hypothetical protein